jgi:sulfate adenylyltransferase subunit 2
LDVWQYIYLESIPIVPLYLAAKRPVVERDGTLIMVNDQRFRFLPGEEPREEMVRFRTLGCYPLSGWGYVRRADTLPLIIREMLMAKNSEREGRVIDFDQDGSMEMKKREGYF